MTTLTQGAPVIPLQPSAVASLIRRHKGDRSYHELAEASGGVVTADVWEQLEHQPLGDRLAHRLRGIEAVAAALGLSEATVRHYVLASRGLPTT
jgi:hypothetical protein